METSLKKKISWKLFFKMLLGSIIATLLVLPYTLSLSPQLKELFSLYVFAGQLIQSAIIFGISIFFGIRLCKVTGFQMTVIEGKESFSHYFRKSLTPVYLGIFAGIIIIGLNFLILEDSVVFLKAEAGVDLWKGFLASFYGGYSEEILFRLFLLNLFIWIGMKFQKNKNLVPSEALIWISIVLTSILFGLGHLGITSSITSITPIIIFRAILLNGIGSMIFGWLYWKKGLEASMISHFSADIILHVIAPAVYKLYI